jgi:hypothetical protein
MWEKRIKAANVFLVGSVLVFSASLFAGDLKVKSLVTFTYKTSDTYQTSESSRSSQHEETVYVQGSRERRDYKVPDTVDVRQPHTAEITNCRTLSVYHIDFNAGKFAEIKLPPFPPEKQVHAFTRQEEKSAKERYSIRTVDTGEKKTAFGLTVSHIITSVHGIGPREHSEATIDGWYSALPRSGCRHDYLLQAEAELSVSFFTAKASQHVYTGFVPPGFAIEETITTHSRFQKHGRHGEIVTVMENKVTELSQEPLDPALFSVPEGFAKVERLPFDVNFPHPALRQR